MSSVSHEQGPVALVTPLAAYSTPALITAIAGLAVSDLLNIRVAFTDFDWMLTEGFTPYNPTIWDWLSLSEMDVPYDDMSVEQKIRFHENQIKLITADIDDPTKRAWAAEQMTALAEEYKAIESLKNGGPGYPPHPTDLH